MSAVFWCLNRRQILIVQHSPTSSGVLNYLTNFVQNFTYIYIVEFTSSKGNSIRQKIECNRAHSEGLSRGADDVSTAYHCV